MIREAIADDAEGFVAAHEAAWDAALAPLVGRKLGDLISVRDRIDRFRAGLEQEPADAGAWVAEKDGTIVGLAVVVDSELRDLYVVPEEWGTGIARSLLETAIRFLRSAADDTATLWVGVDNARARRFYEREGWESTGETRGTPLGVDEVRYRREL